MLYTNCGAAIQNATLLMMGSVGDLPSAPKEQPKFIEDMSEAEATAAVSYLASCLPACLPP